jgi:VanZ family protein
MMSEPAAPVRANHAVELFSVVVAIAYVSLYPFQFEFDASRSLPHVFGLPVWPPASRGDLFGNVLLYVPIGALVVRWLQRRLAARSAAHGWARPVAATPIFLSAVLMAAILSASLEFLQGFEPHRVPSSADFTMNVLGALGGAAGAQLWARSSTARLADPSSPDPRLHLPMGVVALWFLGLTLAWLAAIDAPHYEDAVKSLRHMRSIDPIRMMVELAGWLVVVQALRRLVAPGRCAPVALGLMAAAIAAKLTIVENALRPEELVATLGAALILPQSLRWDRRRGASGLVALLLVAFALDSLRPFAFSSDATPFGWIPLQSALAAGPSLGSLESWLHKLFTCTAMIWLLRESGFPWNFIGGLVIALTGVIELLQCWIPGRTPEITDPLVAAVVVLLARVRTEPPVRI